MANEMIFSSEEIQNVIQEVFKTYQIDTIKIQQENYQAIKNELDKISIYFQQIERELLLTERARKSKLYSEDYGFSQSEIAYKITSIKKDQAIVYHSINKILSYLRNNKEMTYVLYIKSIKGIPTRYEIPASDYENFMTILQSNTFNNEQALKEYSQNALEQMEDNLELTKHIQGFMSAIDSLEGQGLLKKIKQADRYEGFEYHYQNYDSISFNHGFNEDGIRKWFLGRGHDTAGWWVRGDIGLTSVKSVDLSKKHTLLNLATTRSLQETYQLLKELFAQNEINSKQLEQIVRAFTPAIYDIQHGINTDLNEIVDDLVKSLINK